MRLNPYSPDFFSIFHPFEAGIANAISASNKKKFFYEE